MIAPVRETIVYKDRERGMRSEIGRIEGRTKYRGGEHIWE